MNGRVVEFVVQHGPSPIFNRILDSCEGDNDDERYGVEPRIRCAKNAEELERLSVMEWLIERGHMFNGKVTYGENDQEQEIDVCNILELKEQILWHEGQRRILCGPDFIPRELYNWMTMLIERAGWQRDIKVDLSWFCTAVVAL